MNKELFDAPNVVLLPHMGSATTETRHAMGMRAVRNLEAWLAEGISIVRAGDVGPLLAAGWVEWAAG